MFIGVFGGLTSDDRAFLSRLHGSGSASYALLLDVSAVLYGLAGVPALQQFGQVRFALAVQFVQRVRQDRALADHAREAAKTMARAMSAPSANALRGIIPLRPVREVQHRGR